MPGSSKPYVSFGLPESSEAFGHVSVTESNADWLCNMSKVIRSHVHENVLVTTGGGGVGNGTFDERISHVASLAACDAVDVIALHSYSSATSIDLVLGGYSAVIEKTAVRTQKPKKRLVLQEWGVTGANSTAQAAAFTTTAAVAAKHMIPQLFWALQPSHVPLPSTQLAVSAPTPSPSPGRQRYAINHATSTIFHNV